MKHLLAVVLISACCNLYCSIDSLVASTSGLPDSVKIRALQTFAWQYRRTNPVDAVAACEKALELLKKSPDLSKLARTYNILGVANRSLGFYDQSISYLQNALDAAIQSGNNTEIAYAHNNIGGTLLLKAYYARAFNHVISALRIFEDLRDTTGMGYALTNIAYIYKGQKNITRAAEYFYKVYNLRLQIHDSLGALSITDDIAGSLNR